MSEYWVVAYKGSDPGLEPYKNHIFSTYKNSLRFGNPWFKDIDSDVYYATYQGIMEQLLSRPNAVVRLALLKEDLDICLGWSLSEGSKLHYVFVKPKITARSIGIGTALLPKEFDTITHLTTIGRAIWKKKFKTVKFNPFA